LSRTGKTLGQVQIGIRSPIKTGENDGDDLLIDDVLFLKQLGRSHIDVFFLHGI
jgi:hypothetical protein